MLDIIEIVLSTMAWLLGFILSASLYVFFVALVLPKLFLKPKYTVKAPCDRGLKKYLFPDGRAIVYKPSLCVSEYIEQYVLSSKNGEKSIVCKAKRGVRNLCYDVSAFDIKGRLIDIIGINESIDYLLTTQEARLPDKTAYVSIIIRKVNGVVNKNAPELTFSAFKIGMFSLLCSAFTAVEFWLANKLLSHIFTKIFKISTVTSTGSVLVLGIIAGIFLSAMIFLMHLLRGSKIRK